MSNRRPTLRALLILCAAALTSTLNAAVIHVDSAQDLVDAAPGDGHCDVGIAVPPGNPRCTLRAAVMEAEANAEADTIVIAPGLLIDLTLAGSGAAESGDLLVTTEIEILGYTGGEPPSNASLLPRIDASAINDRHFQVANGQLRLRGLRLQGGRVGFAAGSILAFGSGAPIVEIEHVVFSGNSAGTLGGAILAAQSTALTVTDSHFLGNEVRGVNQTRGGAAITIANSATAVIRRSSFVDNRTFYTTSPLVPRATITLEGNSHLRLENSTLGGTPVLPPSPDFEARRGIAVFDAAELIVRNSTITGFVENALYFDALDSGSVARIAHSILASDEAACEATGPNPLAADVEMVYSMIESHSGCSPYYGNGIRSQTPELDLPSFDDPPRLTVSRRPSGPRSNVVDFGLALDQAVDDPEFACIAEDQIGQARPVDADLDEQVRCDFGAIELAPPQPFVVNHFADDLVDAVPGDGSCASMNTPGIGVVCTLRAAVMEANALPGLQHVMFEPSATPALLTLPAATPNGGALAITETLAIDGNLVDGRPATTVDGELMGDRLFLVNAPDGRVYLRNLRLTGGNLTGSGGPGGAIVVDSESNVELHRSELFGNAAPSGGGAILLTGGRIRIIDSDLHANTSEAGPLAIQAGADSVLDISNTSVRDHLGTDSSGAPQPAALIESGADLFLADATFSGNQQGIIAVQPGVVFLRQATMLGQLDGGLIADLGVSSQLFILNSIIAAPSSIATDCQIDGAEAAGFFAIESVLDNDGSCATLADLNGLTANPRLLAIDRPDGQISYSHAPSTAAQAPSPALDVGSTEDCASQDQYGNARPVDFIEVDDLDGPCDLGAVEARLFDSVFADSFEGDG